MYNKMPPYIYRGMARGAATLVNMQDINKDTGHVELHRGSSHLPLPTGDFKKVSEQNKLSGSVANKLKGLKLAERTAKEQKLRELSPIKFSFTQKAN
jgi:hypothetical protein